MSSRTRSDNPVSRRTLLSLAAAYYQHDHAAAPTRKLAVLTAADAADIEALAAQIIPSGATPGAREAGVIFFIDHVLATFDRAQRAAYREGLKLAHAKRLELFPQSKSIATLSSADQQKLTGALEKTPFFEMLREHTIAGFFGNPAYGGNRGLAGWKLIGFAP